MNKKLADLLVKRLGKNAIKGAVVASQSALIPIYIVLCLCILITFITLNKFGGREAIENCKNFIFGICDKVIQENVNSAIPQ